MPVCVEYGAFKIYKIHKVMDKRFVTAENILLLDDILSRSRNKDTNGIREETIK